MVALASMAGVVWGALHWLGDVAALLLVGAFLAETSSSPPSGDATRVVARRSPGERAVELLLAAFERLGFPVEWLRELLMNEGGTAEGNRRAGGVLKRFRRRRRDILASKQQWKERRGRVCLDGATVSLSDFRIVDSKFASYRITVTPAAGVGARWEVWRRMADMIKLKAALSKVSAPDVDLPPLPHSYRRSFDASRLTRRRRSIQHFLQVALEHSALRSSDALIDFLSPEAPPSLSRPTPAAPAAAGAVSPPPEDFVAEKAASSDTGAATGSGKEVQATFSRTRSRSAAAAPAPPPPRTEAVPRERVESGSSGRRLTGGAGGGDGSDRYPELPPSEEDAKEESGSSDGSASSDDQEHSAAFRRGAMTNNGSEGGEHVIRLGVDDAGGAPSPPRSPLGLSPRNSGRKSMHYMKNAVMTGTRRIARSVPMSMPNTKAIQRHIPMPKGVPKFPTKYNPYKRSSNRRSSNDPLEMEGSMVDVLTAAYFDNGSVGRVGDGSVGSFASNGGGGDREVNDLNWRALDGSEDNSSGIGSTSGGAEEYGTANSPLRRKSYLWKRPTGKLGAAGGGQGGGSSNVLLRARSVVETAAAAAAIGAQENGLASAPFVNRRGSSGTFFAEKKDETGRALHPTTVVEAAAAGIADRVGEVAENEQPAPENVSQGRGGDGGGVELAVGVTDGGESHRFKVRGASSASDGLEVPAERAVCPLVYAELFTFANRTEETPAATNGGMLATEGRVDHIATKGRCRRKVADLTVGAAESGDNAVGDLGPPFLMIFNFQIPGDPPLSLVAAWAVHPERLGPDSPDSLRRFFGLFYRLVDIPLSPPLPRSSSSEGAGEGLVREGERGVASPARGLAAAAAAAAKAFVGESSSASASPPARCSAGDESTQDSGKAGNGGALGHTAYLGLADGGVENVVDAVVEGNRDESDTNMAGTSSPGDARNGADSSERVSSGRDQQGGENDRSSFSTKSDPVEPATATATATAADGSLGPDDVRNRRFKLAVDVRKGPSLVTEALPFTGSTLLGQNATLRYFRGQRYLEVDVDLASSPAASQMTSLCRESSKNLSLDVGLILHGENDGELPESVLGVLRIQELDLGDTRRHQALLDM
ncbi:unnamed protein product [Scytosiphon promiscuus]